MKKTIIDVAKIEGLSTLSAISFNETEKRVMMAQVSGTLEMLDACANVKKDKSDALAIGLGVLRDDVPMQLYKRDDILSGAPRVENGYIVIPKVVE